MPNVALFPAHGAQAEKPSRYKPVTTFRFFTGYYTNRNPLRSPLSAFYSEGWGLGRSDTLIDGSNVEVSPRLTVIRRPGLLSYTTATFASAIEGFYSFAQVKNIANPIDLIVDTATGVYNVTPTGATLIFTKSTGAGKTYFQGVGNTLYMSDGADLLAWNDPGATREWGLTAASFSGGLSGPNNPASGVDVPVSGATAWSNPGNITVPDAAYATATAVANSSATVGPSFPTTATVSGTGVSWTNPSGIEADDGNVASVALNPVNYFSKDLTGSGFNFNIPANATVNGVKVEIKANFSNSGGNNAAFIGEVLLAGVTNTRKTSVSLSNTLTYYTFGGATDKWGAALTPSVINSSAFGATFDLTQTQTGGQGNCTVNADAMRITVYYTVPATAQTHLLQGTQYSFALTSTNSVTGIEVVLKGFQSATVSGAGLNVQLLKNGSAVGTAKTNIQLPLSNNTVTLGGNGDFWGASLTASDVSQSSFGVQIQGLNSSGTSITWNIDAAQIGIFGTGGPAISVDTAAGLMSAVTGYQYVVAYGSSTSGHVSTASPPSSSTGVFTSKAGVKVTLVASTDPQVNQIWVFRTADGGDTFLNLPTSPYPNASQTIEDSATDAELNTLQEAPIDHENDPPPSGLANLAYHQGRIWGSVGNTLYASGGPDTVVGNGNEAWPPINFWTFPSYITRLVPSASGLVVVTRDSVQVLSGGPSVSQYYPQMVVAGLGALNYEAVDFYGSQAYLFTSDKQLVMLDLSSGLSEIGFPIADKLLLLDPTAASVAYHTNGLDRGVFVCDGTSTWYRCSPQPPPDFSITGPIWSPPGTYSGGVSLMKSVETSPGVKQLLLGTTTTASTPSLLDSGTASALLGGLGVNISVTLPKGAPAAGEKLVFIAIQFCGAADTTSITSNDGLTFDSDTVLARTAIPTSGDTAAGHIFTYTATGSETATFSFSYSQNTGAQNRGFLGVFRFSSGSEIVPAIGVGDGSPFPTASIAATTNATAIAAWAFSGISSLTVNFNPVDYSQLSLETFGSGQSAAWASNPGPNIVSGAVNMQALSGGVPTSAAGVYATVVVSNNVPVGQVLYRDSSYGTFTDNSSTYDANFTMGSIVLANPGQLAELGFVTAEFNKIGTSPTLSVLIDEIEGTFSPLPTVLQDPPLLYGVTGAPSSLYANRYLFRQSPDGSAAPLPVWCRHLQLKVDYGTDTTLNELLSQTLWGSIMEEGAS